MTTTPLRGPGGLDGPVTAQPVGSGQAQSPPDATEIVRSFNASNSAHDSLWSRVFHANDAVRHSTEEATLARAAGERAYVAHLAIQAEHPQRRAPRLRQLALAGVSVALDAVACYFAAQALGNAQLETVAWAVLLLAVLGSGEVALDYYKERRPRVWRLLVTGLAIFVAGLGVLRYSYLATVGTDQTLAALVAAVLFTAATAGFVMLGYRALRAAETAPTWKARRAALKAAREAAAADAHTARSVVERDRLADAYMSRIRAALLQNCTASQLPLMEAAVRAHLLGRGA